MEHQTIRNVMLKPKAICPSSIGTQTNLQSLLRRWNDHLSRLACIEVIFLLQTTIRDFKLID